MAAASASLAKPDAARRIAARSWQRGAMRARAMSSDWAGSRRLHFIGIGGAGMSGLALVCARLGATVTGSDRADSSYMERLRAAGLEPAVGHDAANLPEGAEVVVSTAIGDDNPELALARERGLDRSSPRRAARRALRREAADRRRRHPRQDDDDGDAGLGAAGDRRRPGLLRRRRGPGAGRRTARRPTPAGARASGSSPRPTRATRSFLRAAARDRGGHQRRDGPPRALGLARRAARLRAFEPAVLPPDGSLTARRVRADVGFDAGARARARRSRCPARHNLLNARAALAAVELAGLDVDAAAAALADFPGVRRRLELKGDARRRRASTTTTPTTRPRCGRRSRRCASSAPSA